MIDEPLMGSEAFEVNGQVEMDQNGNQSLGLYIRRVVIIGDTVMRNEQFGIDLFRPEIVKELARLGFQITRTTKDQ